MERGTSLEAISKFSNRSCTSSLMYDEACLQIFSSIPSPFYMKYKSDECYQCPFVPWVEVSEGESSFIISTKYRSQLMYNLNLTSCLLHFPFADQGIYVLNITDEACGNLKTVLEPEEFYLPIVFAVIVAILGGILWKTLLYAWNSNLVSNWRRRNSEGSEIENDIARAALPEDSNVLYSQELQAVRRRFLTRIKSLDVFRGITISFMILVNYGGGKYWFLEHAPWNGLTIADLVFPWFAWIMGVSIAISLRSQLRSSTTRRKLFYKVFRRFLWLFILGLILNTLGGYRNGLQEIRILGVLQRLGLSYFIVASMEAFLMKPQGMVIDGFLMYIREVVECWKQWLFVLLLVACHTCLTFLLKVPGCPKGYQGPGGLHFHGLYSNCTGGAAGFIDRMILGENHMYQNPTCEEVYQTTMPFDPEGVLGTLPTVLLVFLGVQAGRILLTYSGSATRILRLLILFFLTGVISGFLCGFSKEKGIIPLNKNLWSISYVLFTGASAFLIEALLFFIIDVKKWWSGSPFFYAGMNPLILYVGHVIARGMFPWFWKPVYNTHAEMLAMNLWGTSLWILISYFLYQYNVFLAV